MLYLAAMVVAIGVVVVAISNRDATSVLSALLVLLFLVPEDKVLVGPLKSYGYPAMLVGVAGLLIWLAGSLLGWFEPSTRDPVHWLIFGFLLAAVCAFAAGMMRPLTPIESTGATRATVPLLAEVGIALLAYDGLKDRQRLESLLYRLVIIVGVSATIGIIEFFWGGFRYATFLSPPGLTVHVDIIDDVRSSFQRVQAAAAHPIEYCVGCAAMVPIGLHYARYATSKARRQLAGLAAFTMLVVLPMAVARSAILALVVALLVYGVQWNWRVRLNAIILGVFGLAAFRAVVPGLLGTLLSLFTNASNDPSVQSRTDDYALLPALLEHHLIFGRGLGTFQWQQYFYLDDQYLGSLLEGGIIGLCALAALFIVGMGLARGARKRASDDRTRDLGQALAASMAALAVSAATFDELGFKQTAFLIFLLVGVSGALRRMAMVDAEVPTLLSTRVE